MASAPKVCPIFENIRAWAALTAIVCLRERLPASQAAIRRGIGAARLAGRFETVGERPLRILDVAHNPQAVAELARNLEATPCTGKTLAVVGMLADKDIAGALAVLAGKVDVWLLAGLDGDGPRGAPAAVLARAVAGLGGRVETFAAPQEAFARAVGLAGENDRIATFGSFHTVAAVMRALAGRQ